MSYQEETKNYFTMVIAALIVVAIAVASIVYSLLRTEPEDIDIDVIENISDNVGTEVDDVIHLDPSDLEIIGPTGPPPIHKPTEPPPGYSFPN
ncbi:hypothetical protein ACFL21_00105 [Patescibacteria group bacterium]